MSCDSNVGQCMSDYENSIGFMEVVHAPTNVKEVPIRNQEAHYRTSIQSEALGGVAAAVTQNLPSYPIDDFSTMSMIYQPGPDTWPIVIMHYVYVARNMTHLTEVTQGLMLAFLQALYEPSYIHQCQTLIGMSKVPEHVRDLGMDGLGMMVRTDSQATLWNFESEFGDVVTGDYVLSDRRHSFAMQHHFALQKELDDLKDAVITDLQHEIATLKSDNEYLRTAVEDLQTYLNDLKESPMYNPSLTLQPEATPDGTTGSTNLRPGRFQALDDDTPISVQDGLPIYTTVQGNQLQAALVLAAMSFTFWAVYFIWKIFYFFFKA